MYTLSTEHSFDSAHFLKDYDGKCKNIHGHRWKIVATIKGDNLQKCGQERGMLVDFGSLKKDLREEVDILDHKLIIEKNSLDSVLLNAMKQHFEILEFDFRPTAEELAYYLFKRMQGKGHPMYKIVVYETPNNYAEYTEE